MCDIRIYNIDCAVMHPKGENNFVKRSKNTQNPRWRHVYVEIQDGRYFCKIVYVIADPQIYRTFESIKNCQRCDFLKIFVIPGGNATPHKFQRGDTSAPLPNRSGRYQGTTPTTWLNFNTPCKSQPTILPY